MIRVLIGNHSVLAKSVGRRFGGSTQSGDRSSWQTPGALRGRFAGAFNAKSATPNGYLHPAALLMPQTAGGIGSNTLVLGAGDLTGTGAMGKNAVANLDGSGDLVATGELVVSAVATLTGSGLITDAASVATLNAAATLAGSGDVAGGMRALAEAVATINAAGALTTAPGPAPGELSATISAAGDILSPSSLASAVWNAAASAFSDPTSMGGQLNFMYLLAHNKVVTDPTAGTMTIYDTDGVTVLYIADLWENTAGSQAYRGQGAERREEFDTP